MSQPALDDNHRSSVELPPPPSVTRGVRILATICGALIATATCYFTLAATGNIYPTPPEVLSLGAAPTPEEYTAASSAQLTADTGNAVVWFGLIGAIIAAVFALMSGLVRRSGTRVILAVCSGIILGGGMGWLAATVAVQSYATISTELVGATSGAETKFMVMHGITMLLFGLAAGLACELGNRFVTLKSAFTALVIGGIMGGVAGIGFPLLVAIADPLLDSSRPVPAIGTGLIVFVGLGSLLIGIGVDQATTSK